MDGFQKITKDEFWLAPKARGQRMLNLEKIFSAIQMFLENEESLHKSCVNAGLPYTAIYENYTSGKELAKNLNQKMEVNPELKNKSATTFDLEEREVEQLNFYGSIERAKQTSIWRGKKYLGFTLEQAEQEVERFKTNEKNRIESLDKAGEGETKGPVTFEPNPEVLKLIKWLLERRESDRYKVRVDNNLEGDFSFNVQFEDMPAINPMDGDDLTTEPQNTVKPDRPPVESDE